MITYGILFFTIAFSVYAMNKPDVKYKYIFHPYSINRYNQHYRFLSHAFLHGDYIHLAFNMYALLIFGPVVETFILPNLLGELGEPNYKLGSLFFVLLYTFGIYASSISEYLKNRNFQYYTSLGASGAVNALLFSYITCMPFSRPGFYFLPLPAWAFGILYLTISYFLSRRKTGTSADNVGHEAHFWGALFGVLFTLVLGLLNPDVYFYIVNRFH